MRQGRELTQTHLESACAMDKDGCQCIQGKGIGMFIGARGFFPAQIFFAFLSVMGQPKNVINKKHRDKAKADGTLAEQQKRWTDKYKASLAGAFLHIVRLHNFCCAILFTHIGHRKT